MNSATVRRIVGDFYASGLSNKAFMHSLLFIGEKLEDIANELKMAREGSNDNVPIPGEKLRETR